MSKKVLVYGWYFNGNAGDDLFIDAFKKIFPELNFTFTNEITSSLLQENDVIFIGGGSFLEFPIKMTGDLLDQIKTKKIFYIGVGAETKFHSMHIDLIKMAKIVAIRSNINLSDCLELNKNTIVIPDIVYSLYDDLVYNEKIPNSVLILPNISVVPNQQDPHWKHAAWDYFKSEMSQFLDLLIEQDYKINFLTMCENEEYSDSWAAIELINRMCNKSTKYLLPRSHDIKDLSKIFSSYQLVVSQRYHGLILSEMIKVPYISIHHHDKLKISPSSSGKNGEEISYYSFNKNLMLNKLKNALNFKPIMLIERDIFKELNKVVLNLLSSE